MQSFHSNHKSKFAKFKLFTTPNYIMLTIIIVVIIIIEMLIFGNHSVSHPSPTAGQQPRKLGFHCPGGKPRGDGVPLQKLPCKLVSFCSTYHQLPLLLQLKDGFQFSAAIHNPLQKK